MATAAYSPDGIAISNERGANADVTISNQISSTENTSNAGNTGTLQTGGGTINMVDNSVRNDVSAGVINSAFDYSHADLVSALNYSATENGLVASQMANLATYTRDAYNGALSTVVGFGTSTLNALTNANDQTLRFFGTETDQILRSSQQNTAQLQSATVGAIKSASDAAQSQDAQQLTQLQSTLVKLAIGMGAVIVAFAYFNRKG